MGGGPDVGSVPCRDVVVENCTLRNDVTSAVHNADFHGNVEDCKYINCNIFGGVTWQGRDNGYINCRIHPTSIGVVVTSAEILGGNFYLRNCDVYTLGNPQDSSRGVVDIGGNSTPVSSDTVFDCHFEVTGGKWDGITLGSNTFLVYFRNRGTTQKVNFKIDGIDLDLNDFSTVLRTDLISGTADSDYIIIDNISTALNGKSIAIHFGGDYLNFPHRLPMLSGRQVVTTDTGEITTLGVSDAYKWVFPRTPSVNVSRTNRGAVGSSFGIPAATVANATSVIPALRNETGANWVAATTVDLCWTATIREI